MIALMPKPGAETEAQLSPIGILSYIYRVWMAIRKAHTRQWSLSIHGHLVASRAVASGWPDTVVRMSMDVYSGPRLIGAHGAVARTVQGHHGLIVGCSFAKDHLKSFLRPVEKQCRQSTFRDFVDDLVLIAVCDTPAQAAMGLTQDLGAVREALQKDNMLLNDEKQQV